MRNAVQISEPRILRITCLYKLDEHDINVRKVDSVFKPTINQAQHVASPLVLASVLLKGVSSCYLEAITAERCFSTCLITMSNLSR